MSSYLNQNSYSRGIRNNNPGNLIYTTIPWSGKISYANNTDWEGTPANIKKHFEQFTSMQAGVRAMAYDLIGDIKDNNYSLAQLIYEYAPPSENNTALYIDTVKNAANIADANAPLQLNGTTLHYLIRAMVLMENGNDGYLVTDADINEGITMLPPVLLAELGQFIQEHKTSLGLTLAGITAATVTGIYLYKRSNRKKAA